MKIGDLVQRDNASLPRNVRAVADDTPAGSFLFADRPLAWLPCPWADHEIGHARAVQP